MKPEEIKLNAAKCAKCGAVIVSLTLHDWQTCPCQAIYIDGGYNYPREGGEPKNFAAVTAQEASIEKARREKSR